MQIEDQITSLDFCKKLKELGVAQDSLFYRFQCEGHQYIYCKYYEQYSPQVNLDIKNGYSAFTASELLNIMPYLVDTNENAPFNYFRLRITKSFIVDSVYLNRTFIYLINYWCDTVGPEKFMGVHLTANIYDANFANALAKMLIYLIENKLMDKDNYGLVSET